MAGVRLCCMSLALGPPCLSTNVMLKRPLWVSVAFVALGIFLWALSDDRAGAVGLTVAHEAGRVLTFYWNRDFDFPTGEALWLDMPTPTILTFLLAAAFSVVRLRKNRSQA
jgi:hypothetical protein